MIILIFCCSNLCLSWYILVLTQAKKFSCSSVNRTLTSSSDSITASLLLHVPDIFFLLLWTCKSGLCCDLCLVYWLFCLICQSQLSNKPSQCISIFLCEFRNFSFRSWSGLTLFTTAFFLTIETITCTFCSSSSWPL